jgi:hypothetical protein
MVTLAGYPHRALLAHCFDHFEPSHLGYGQLMPSQVSSASGRVTAVIVPEPSTIQQLSTLANMCCHTHAGLLLTKQHSSSNSSMAGYTSSNPVVLHLVSPLTTRTLDKQRHRSICSRTCRTANYSSMPSSWHRGSKNNNRTLRGVCDPTAQHHTGVHADSNSCRCPGCCLPNAIC